MNENLNKHIWEGWRVCDFIEALSLQIGMIMGGNSFRKPFTSKTELAEWCKDNQPYYKKRIPEVNAYFTKMYNLK